MRYHTRQIPAVILAGGVNTIKLYPGHVPGPKALLRYGGRSCLASVSSVMQTIPAVGPMCIIGSEPSVLRDEGVAPSFEFLPGGQNVSESVAKGLQHFAASNAVLFVTADLPMITSRAVTDFLQRIPEIDTVYDENIFLSLVPDDCFTGDFRKISKGFVRFKDITVCHGNLFVLDSRIRHKNHVLATVQSIYDARKSSLRAALAMDPMLGLVFLLGVRLLHLLSMGQTARLASRRLGTGLIPVVIEHPEIAIDVDEPQDHTFLKRQLG